MKFSILPPEDFVRWDITGNEPVSGRKVWMTENQCYVIALWEGDHRDIRSNSNFDFLQFSTFHSSDHSVTPKLQLACCKGGTAAFVVRELMDLIEGLDDTNHHYEAATRIGQFGLDLHKGIAMTYTISTHRLSGDIKEWRVVNLKDYQDYKEKQRCQA